MRITAGPGDPDCKHCDGRGVVPAPPRPGDKGNHPPAFNRCRCVLQQDITANVERGMRKLLQAMPIKQSPIIEAIDDDLWVTASKAWFTANLRHIAIRQPPTWYFKVVSDADLMTAWLASAALKGKGILDPDAAKVSLTHVTLVDLIMPPQLLIIRLGIKQARNIATPEVLLEALRAREHAGLPTWVWDTPREKLAEGHICWSVMVAEYLSTWRHVQTRDTHMTPKAQTVPPQRWASAHNQPDEADEPLEDEGTEEIDALRGAHGHVDLTMKRPMRMTMSDGGGRKSLRDEGDE